MMSTLEWKFLQVFGDRSPVDEVTDVDVVSAIEFDETGDYIAAGDKGGRVVIFEREKAAPAAKKSKHAPSVAEYKFYSEFQSHEPEFDYLKSLEIEEKINKIRWCRRQNNAHFLLTTNDKTIKLWKVFEKKIRHVNGVNIDDPDDDTVEVRSLKVPKCQTKSTEVAAAPRRVFANAHAYHINSIALNSDGETYLSADDLRINLWSLGIQEQSFNIVDIKPPNMEELTEVITCSEFHPRHCNILMFSSSKGTIKLADMRAAALCDQHAKVFEEPEDPANKSFFSEIIASISDIKFGGGGRYIVARDYLTVKIWDMNMENKPVRTIAIHDHLRSKLCDLYENDCIFDKFECTLSPDGNAFLSGSYHNYFHLFERQSKNSLTLEASKSLPKHKKSGLGKLKVGKGRKNKGEETNPDNIDFSKKILHTAWHPSDKVIAVAAANNLFLYAV